MARTLHVEPRRRVATGTEMSFRLRDGQPIARELRRLAQEELRSARQDLRRSMPPEDTAIREARKSLKKVRAIAKLIGADDGRGLGKDPKRLRKVSRTLAGVRDADARLEILTKLTERNPRVVDEHTFARLRRSLAAHKNESKRGAARRGAWRAVNRTLGKLRKGAGDWRPAHRRFRAIATGLEATHRRGRRLLARARKRQRAEDFHEWRKQVKALWYELRLIASADRSVARDVAALDRAAEWLGDDHNVVLLCDALDKDAAACDLQQLRAAAVRYQRELRRKAIAATRRIYARKSAAYVRDVKRAWKNSRRGEAAGSRRPLRGRAA